MSKKLFIPARAKFFGWIYLIGLCISTQGFAEVSVRGEPLQTSELQVMTPLCKLIVVDVPNAHLGAGTGPLAKYAPLFEEPRYQMAKGNIHIHHYCWALVSKQRYFRERSKAKRDYYLAQFMGDIDYVLKHSNKSWPYFDVLLVEQGQMQMILGNFSAALAKANEALKYKPSSEIAYVLKTDAYKNMGNKTAAISTAKEGIEKNPYSTRLRKSLTRLDQVAPPMPESTPPVAESASPKDPASPDSASGTPSVTTATPDTSESTQDNKNSREVETIGTKNNPYCRFCP